MTRKQTLSAVAGLAAWLGAGAVSADTKLSCDTVARGEISIAARYFQSPQRATFDVAFKAPPGTPLPAGSRLSVEIDGTIVGWLDLRQSAAGKIGASLSFDSYGDSAQPFPVRWPGVGSNSSVTIGGVMGCRLAA